MKKSILIIILFICYEGFSQITLDFQTSVPNLRTVRMSNSVTKYSEDLMSGNIGSITNFILYNLDGSVYKTIYLPPKPDPSAIPMFISNISESLFDNESTNIEYLITYQVQIAGNYAHLVQVVREDGTVLLNELYANLYFSPPDFIDASIFNTEEGAKLRLYYGDTGTKVFSLPGNIPTNANNHFNASNNNFSIYPNPNNGSFFIKFSLQNNQQSTINLYSPLGVLLNTYHSEERIIHINNSSLPSGCYFLKTNSNETNSSQKVLIEK